MLGRCAMAELRSFRLRHSSSECARARILIQNLPVFNAPCYNLQVHARVNGLQLRTGKEGYDSLRLNINRHSLPMVSSEARTPAPDPPLDLLLRYAARFVRHSIPNAEPAQPLFDRRVQHQLLGLEILEPYSS